jgi:hypothetical protein
LVDIEKKKVKTFEREIIRTKSFLEREGQSEVNTLSLVWVRFKAKAAPTDSVFGVFQIVDYTHGSR